MTDTIREYRDAVMTCRIAAAVLVCHDIDKHLGAIAQADAVGWALDPTLYRDKSKAMHEDRELLEAARPLVEWAKKHAKQVG